MKRTADELAGLMKYEKLSAMRLLRPPKLAKEQIPDLIACSNFQKAMGKIEQSMERYSRKLQSIEQDIETQNGIIDEANRKTRYCDTSDAQSVARHNDWVERGRAAVEKHNDLIDRHREAKEEANERRSELEHEALMAIDDDIVAVLDKSSRIAEKLSGGHNSADSLVAMEILLMEMRVFHFLEDHIEGNAQRKDARERIADVNRTFGTLCASEEVRNYLADVFRRNGFLVERNAGIHAEIGKVLGSVDQQELNRLTKNVTSVLDEKVETKFNYDGVVDPAELDKIVVNFRGAIDALKRGITKAQEAAATTKPMAEAAESAHQNAGTLLASMKSNVEAMGLDLLGPGHFACEMLEEAVIDDFYPKDLRPNVADLRKHVATAIGEEQLDLLVEPVEDRYAIDKAEGEIKQAQLLRLKEARSRIDAHVKKLTDLIAGCDADIAKVGEAPKRNAEAFRSDVSPKYLLSCVPVVGVLFAFGIMGRVKAFAAGFQSKNETYRALAVETAAKNKSMTTTMMVLAGVAAVAGIVGFVVLRADPHQGMVAGVAGGVTALLYLSTYGIFSGIGKQLGA